jgi:cytochrome P450
MTDFEYDPTLPSFQADPLPIFARLRDEHPAYHNERLRFWALTRHEDVRAAAADHETFASSPAHYPAEPEEPTALIARSMMDFGIFYLDPPRHDQLRALLARTFTPRRVAGLEPIIRRLAKDLLRRIADRGTCELVHDFAAPLSTEVIGALLGVPSEERWSFRLWAEKIEQRDPTIAPDVAHREQQTALAGIHETLRGLVAARKKSPQDDLMSALLSAEVDRLRLGDEEVVSIGYQLMVAGNDTTASLISNGALRLAEHPEQRRKLVGDPGRIPDAVEEMARYDSPTVQSPPRIATRDVHLHGQWIPKGSPVLLVWMAANHDDRVFSEPERFDVTRETRRHLGFGHGLHFCIGASLARLEARVAFEELLQAMPDYSVDGEPMRWASVFLRSLGALPIAFDAQRARAAIDRQ